MNKTLWIIIIVVVLGTAGVLIFREPTPPAGDTELTPNDDDTVQPQVLEDANAVAISNQAAGDSVEIGLVVLSEPGYVVIHEDADGKPGAVIGHSQILSLTNTNIVVALDRLGINGEFLYAMLHTDDGDGVYNFPGDDIPIVTSQGKIVLMGFTIGEAVAEGPVSEPISQPRAEEETLDQPPPETAQNLIVTYDGSAFSPKSLTIKQGDTVTWRNESNNSVWPASTFHPTHTVYPGSGIQKCGSQEASQIFDSCSGLSNGGSYSFTFSQVGAWNYHNHLSPGKTGTIVVE